jgi:hypothetical protein
MSCLKEEEEMIVQSGVLPGECGEHPWQLTTDSVYAGIVRKLSLRWSFFFFFFKL